MFEKKQHPALKARLEQEIYERAADIERQAKFVSPRNVKKLFGPTCPLGYKMFSNLLDIDLINFNNGLQQVGTDAAGGTGYIDEWKLKDQNGFADRLLRIVEQNCSNDTSEVGEEAFDILIEVRQGKPAYSRIVPLPKEESKGRATMVRLAHNDFGRHPWVISVPLPFLMRGFHLVKSSCMGYTHSIVITESTQFH